MSEEHISDKNALRTIAAAFIMSAIRITHPLIKPQDAASAAVEDTDALFERLNAKPKQKSKYEHRKTQQEHLGN